MPVTLFSYRLIFVKENCFSLRLFLNFSHEIDNIYNPGSGPADRIQIGPKFWIRVQIQCIWIHNTGLNHKDLLACE